MEALLFKIRQVISSSPNGTTFQLVRLQGVTEVSDNAATSRLLMLDPECPSKLQQ